MTTTMPARAAKLGNVLVVFASLLGVTLATREALADDAVCVQAAENAQLSRRDGKLLQARDSLLVCGGETCPAEVKADCVRWLDEVDHATPSISIALRDASGHDLTQAAISIDGAARAEGLGSASIPLDPGAHHLRLVPDGHTPLEADILLREGEKQRVISLALPPDPTLPKPSPSRITPLVIVTSAITVLAAASTTYFGVKAVVDRHALDSTCPHCSSSDISTVKTEAAICDVSLGVTAIGAGMTTWLIVRPVSSPDPTVGGRPISGARIDWVGRF